MMLLQCPVFRLPRKPVFSRGPARAAWAAALLLLAAPWAAAQTTFNYTGAVQTYTVPAGAGGVTIQANGAGGGSGGNDSNGWGGAGGAGARATGTYYAAPGTVLNIYVGQGGRAGNTSQGAFTCANAAGAGGLAGGATGFAGGSGGQAGCDGWSGGGAGGGAASVVATAANARLVVAGGGGGGQGGALDVLGRAGLAAPVTPIGALPGSAGAAGTTRVGDGSGGGGGCPGGAGGAELVDSSGTNNTLQARGGSSCSDTAAVTAFSVTAAGAAGGASVTGTAPASGNNGGNGSVVITPLNPTRLITKSQPSPALAVGRDSVYTLTVTASTSTPFFTATVGDQLPANLTYVGWSGTGWTCPTATGGTGTLVACTYSSTTATTTATLNITVRPTSTTTVTNRASVGSVGNATQPAPSTCTGNNTPVGCATPVTNTPTNAILNLVKSAPSPALKVGSNSAYTLTVTNTGTTASTTARILDQLPANLTYVSGVGTGWTCSTAPSGGGTLVTCDYTGSIATGGGTAAVVITVTPTSAASVTNYAAVDRTGGTNTPTPSTCTAANTPTAGCAAPVTSTPTIVILGLVKSAPSPALQVFSNSAYTLTVTNSGTAASTTARITDQLPANLTYVSGVGTGWSCSAAGGGGALVTCNYSGSLAAGGGTSAVVITVTATSNASTTNYASVDPTGGTAPPTPTSCTAANTPSAGCAAPVTSIAGRPIAGTVYADVNHNGSLEAGESGIGGASPLFVKLVPVSGGICTGPAVAAASVTLATGAYSLSSVAEGSYCLILDGNGTLSDITAAYPTGWIGTQNPSGVIQLAVGAAPPAPQNFGLYNGSTLSGNVFADNGAGGGTANNGVKAGTEPGLAGITVNAMQGATTLDSEPTASDGSFILWIPGATTGTVVLTPVLPAGYTATGGSAGTTGGSYTRPSVSYTAGAGLARTGISFGMVAPNTLSPNGAQTAQPGTVVFYAHSYKAATGGSVTFSMANIATPASPAWNQVLYQDGDCNAALEASETQVTTAVTVTAGQTVCLVIKQFVPAGAGQGAQNSITLSAAFTYTNSAPALAVTTLLATDITTVGQAGDLSLAKLVSNITQALPAATSVNANPGDTLQYTLTATNNGTQPLSTLFVSDSTAAFTGFVSATCPGSLPTGITGCTVTTQPAVNAQGALKWTFTGSLASGGQLVVTYRVKVDQ